MHHLPAGLPPEAALKDTGRSLKAVFSTGLLWDGAAEGCQLLMLPTRGNAGASAELPVLLGLGDAPKLMGSDARGTVGRVPPT